MRDKVRVEPSKLEEDRKEATTEIIRKALEEEGKNGFLVIYTIKSTYGKNEFS